MRKKTETPDPASGDNINDRQKIPGFPRGYFNFPGLWQHCAACWITPKMKSSSKRPKCQMTSNEKNWEPKSDNQKVSQKIVVHLQNWKFRGAKLFMVVNVIVEPTNSQQWLPGFFPRRQQTHCPCILWHTPSALRSDRFFVLNFTSNQRLKPK